MIHLASQSERRRALLAQIGVPFEVIDVAVPEVRAAGEPPADYVERVACAKARAGRALLAARDPAAWVLGADTDVVLGDRVFGKPHDAAMAAEMLRALAARTHRVLSSVCLVGPARARCVRCASQVTFGAIGDGDIARYVATGEWAGKAGGYAIQGRAAAFIARLEGSYSGVMGLPLFETFGLLRAAGLAP